MGEWVAIVDDDVADLTASSHILYKNDMKVSTFKSGKDLLTFLNHNRPDLVLLKMHMPGFDGLSVLQSLRARDELYDLPVIFLLDNGTAGDWEKGVSAGALDLIAKPFSPEYLLFRVRRAIELARLRHHADEEVEQRTREFLDRQEQIRQLSDGAVTDPLTGLLDKASAQDAISLLVREMHGILLLIDLDSFKPVNDIYGKNAGDKILARFAEIIRSAVRTNDIVGRIGGDAFIAFCENTRDEAVVNEKARFINDELVTYAR